MAACTRGSGRCPGACLRWGPRGGPGLARPSAGPGRNHWRGQRGGRQPPGSRGGRSPRPGSPACVRAPSPPPKPEGAPGARGKPVASLPSPVCGPRCSRGASGLDGAAAPEGKGRGRGGLTGSGAAEPLPASAGVSAPPRLTWLRLALTPRGERRPAPGRARGSLSPVGTGTHTHIAPAWRPPPAAAPGPQRRGERPGPGPAPVGRRGQPGARPGGRRMGPGPAPGRP